MKRCVLLLVVVVSGLSSRVLLADDNLALRLKTLEEKMTEWEKKGVGGPLSFNAFWKEGLNFESFDGNFKLKIGGRVFSDFAWFDDSTQIMRRFGDIQDGVEFRAARLGVEGTVYGDVFYKAEWDFGAGTVAAKDIYMGVKGLPLVNTVQVGHFKEPIGLEELTSARFITFMERSTMTSTFIPSRNMGIMASNSVLNDRATWALGAFRDVNDQGFLENDEGYAMTGRVTALPCYHDKGRRMLHTGLGWSVRHNVNDLVQYRTRPEWHFGPRFADTGAFGSERQQILTPELAWVHGPLSLQTEYTHVFADVERHRFTTTHPGLHDADFSGFYVMASYFLTGENRNYDVKKGAFSRVKPLKNFSPKAKTWGAWELATRYSIVDLDANRPINGRDLEDVTMGLNWYWNPNMRVMFNYIHTELNSQTHPKDELLFGDANIFAVRFQFDF